MRTGADLLDDIDAGNVGVGELARELRRLPGAPSHPSPRTRYNLACHYSTSSVEVSVRLLGNDSKRETRPWAFDDPSLRRLRSGSQGPSLRAALRRGCSSLAPSELNRFDTIGVIAAEQLARSHLYTAPDLLLAAGPKANRDRLAKTLTVVDSQLVEWANLCELAGAIDRAEKKPGQEYRAAAYDIANLLSLSGIGSCKALAGFKDAVTALTKRLSDLNGELLVIAPKVITSDSVKRWVEDAATVDPSRVEPSTHAPASGDKATADAGEPAANKEC